MRPDYHGAVLKKLADGNWHPFHELFSALKPLIPPESAMRECKVNGYLTHDIEEAVRRGRRRRVLRSLRKIASRGHIERRGVGDNAEWRRL